ncbi:porin, partial [Turicimonas muris]
MKQLSIALLAALSVTATAYAESSVTVYGRIDVGVGASHVDNGLGSTVNNVEMISGGGTSNRIGIKGTEDLGNGYKVKFVLENGFDSDTGAE